MLGLNVQRAPREAPTSIPNILTVIENANPAEEDNDDGIVLSHNAAKPMSECVPDFAFPTPTPALTLELDNVCNMCKDTQNVLLVQN